MILPYVAALLSPVLWGVTNIIDKYLVSHRIKSPVGFAVLAGVIQGVAGIFLAGLNDWSSVSLYSLSIPFVAGILLGAGVFSFYLLLSRVDVSNAIGLLYVYPVLVSILSFMFLGEVISSVGYLGMVCTVVGAVWLSIGFRKIKGALPRVAVFILVTAGSDFLIKAATTTLSASQGTAIHLMGSGFCLLCGALIPSIRQGFVGELQRWPWAVLIQCVMFVGLGAMYVAMVDLPATFVSSVAAIQPISVLLMEWVVDRKIGRISKDHQLLPKVGPIVMIVVGVVLLYATV